MKMLKCDAKDIPVNQENSVLAMQIAKIGEYMIKHAGDIGNVNHIHLCVDFIVGRKPMLNITTSTDVTIEEASMKGGF